MILCLSATFAVSLSLAPRITDRNTAAMRERVEQRGADARCRCAMYIGSGATDLNLKIEDTKWCYFSILLKYNNLTYISVRYPLTMRGRCASHSAKLEERGGKKNNSLYMLTPG